MFLTQPFVASQGQRTQGSSQFLDRRRTRTTFRPWPSRIRRGHAHVGCCACAGCDRTNRPIHLGSGQRANQRSQRFGVRGGQTGHGHDHDHDRDGTSYSHSMVAGGLDEMSYTTRLIPRTSFTMRDEMVASRSCDRGTQSAVMPSRECTARRASTLA